MENVNYLYTTYWFWDAWQVGFQPCMHLQEVTFKLQVTNQIKTVLTSYMNCCPNKKQQQKKD